MRPGGRGRGGLIDGVAALLCCWAAAFHTPAGALVRNAVAHVLGRRADTRPLLAYYSGGVFDAEAVMPAPPVDGPPSPEALAIAQVGAGDALARGLYVSAGRAGQAPLRSVDEASARLEGLRRRFPTDDAAALAHFAGEPLADFAVRRVRAEGGQPSLEALARHLPPSAAGAVAATAQTLALGTAFGLGWPVDRATRISSPFGWRTHPTLARPQLHTGVDLAVPAGTGVTATAAGVVRRASEDDVNGRVVIIDHGFGVSTAYCHNEALLVHVGERVQAGQQVALSGSTGRSTGPHVHYQLELARRPVDPQLFARGIAPDVQPPPAKPQAPAGPSPALRSALDRFSTPPATEDAP